MRDNVISVTRERVVFDGHLGKVKAHSHAVVALVIGVERPFTLVTAVSSASCAVAIVPASVVHQLDFFDRRAIVVYIEPHDPAYGSFHRAAAGTCPTQAQLGEGWRRAVGEWEATRNWVPLFERARENFVEAEAEVEVDRRVRELAASFNSGELLDAALPEMAARLRLSGSRLLHLLKLELGVGVRKLKQHYRFKVAALATARGESLTTAAHAAGFADSGHFSRTFLDTFGLNPSQVLLRTASSLEKASPLSPPVLSSS